MSVIYRHIGLVCHLLSRALALLDTPRFFQDIEERFGGDKNAVVPNRIGYVCNAMAKRAAENLNAIVAKTKDQIRCEMRPSSSQSRNRAGTLSVDVTRIKIAGLSFMPEIDQNGILWRLKAGRHSASPPGSYDNPVDEVDFITKKSRFLALSDGMQGRMTEASADADLSGDDEVKLPPPWRSVWVETPHYLESVFLLGPDIVARFRACTRRIDSP